MAQVTAQSEACESHLARFQVPLPVERITREALEALSRSDEVTGKTRGMIETFLAVQGDEDFPEHGCFVGPFVAAGVDLRCYDRGARVRLPKGIEVSCAQLAPTQTRRSYTVEVHTAYAGFVNPPYVSSAKIVWAGSEGRWREADLDSILGAGGGLVGTDSTADRMA